MAHSDRKSNDQKATVKAKLTKREQRIEEKLKNRKTRSLFDTDGDLSKHNIIEGSRRRRTRTDNTDSALSTKPLKRKKHQQEQQQQQQQQQQQKPLFIENAKNKLLPPLSGNIQLDNLKKDCIEERLGRMAAIQQQHNASVKELYHLELFQNMLDYDPHAFINDVRYNTYVAVYDLWKSLQLDPSFKVKLEKEKKDKCEATLLDLLQSAVHETILTESKAIADNNKTSTSSTPSIILQQQLIHTIHTGTGLRRQNRQFTTLMDYLNSFYASIEGGTDDITPEARLQYIEKEKAIRQRLYALEQRGGFLTRQFQNIAHYKNPHPHSMSNHCNHHQHLISTIPTASKQFHNMHRYKITQARRCAKAIDRYWETIRTQDERRQREEKKKLVRLAKWTAQQVKKKWKLVERICEARSKELLKEQQAEEGRRHLEKILEHSEHVLGARQEELARHQQMQQQQQKQQQQLSRENSVVSMSGTSATTWTSYPSEENSSSIMTDDQQDDLWEQNEEEQEDVKDHILDEEDVITESEDDDQELRELEEDQNLSVEELMRKYNVSNQEILEKEEDVADVIEEDGEEDENAEGEFALTSDTEDIPIEEDGESESDTEELNALQNEAGLSVEELLQKYNYRPDLVSETEEEDGDDHTITAAKRALSSDNVNNEDNTMISSLKRRKITSNDDSPERTTLSALLEDEKPSSSNEQPSTLGQPDTPTASDTVDTIQPTGNTLDTTTVITPIPFLLRGTLREYQHVGLDWLASLYKNGLNGILADEMGLGKTIQTISLLAYLACERSVWGPHLIVVPTSVILNWEMEFKKWLPAFKIMTYYGNTKERKLKRSGWSKENAFHVCITSYQLVLQDQSVFRRKAWHYLVLDEAHHIKNFRSQRWQVLLNFNAKRRLLLTGTPLQNNLMELWSLLYFLMPNGVSQHMPVGFANLKEFQEWFSQPVDRLIKKDNYQRSPHQEDQLMLDEQAAMIEEESRAAIQKLHTVLRPYLLRRLKIDVERQMPEKHEHIVYCKLSKRQRFLYDDFMSRAKTKETLASGSFLSIINCLMQLRKVCNHPDLFEERPILTSFAMTDDVQFTGQKIEAIIRRRLLTTSTDAREKLDLNFLNLVVTDTNQNRRWISRAVADDTMRLEAAKEILTMIACQQKHITTAESHGITSSKDYHDLKKYAKYREMRKYVRARERWQMIYYVNHFRCAKKPLYDSSFIQLVSPSAFLKYKFNHDPRYYMDSCESLYHAIQSYKQRIEKNRDIIEQFGFVTPKVVIHAEYRQKHQQPSEAQYVPFIENRTDIEQSVASVDELTLSLIKANTVENDIFHPIKSRLSIAFPDKRLLQYDCGKLQKLDVLLKQLAAGGHRALIFTQMTRVLDILETFLNMHGHRYLRLDGATKVEQRQVLTEHFNNDKRILCFILSTRSGGLGINLTGADTVIFYDSDWNPSMDKQCQDRAHRIGQTRDVHIYRFVTEFTIEENIFKKANQKRMLDNVVIQEGGFTDDYFNKNDWWKDLPEVVGSAAATSSSHLSKQLNNDKEYEQALLEAEDENDAAAAIAARKEMNLDEQEFVDDSQSRSKGKGRSESVSQQPTELYTTSELSTPLSESAATSATTPSAVCSPLPLRQVSEAPTEMEEDGSMPTVTSVKNDEEADGIQYNRAEQPNDEDEAEGGSDIQLDVGHVDQYMLQFWEREMVGVDLGFGGFVSTTSQ
ncbi:SNF2 family N-terminal domain-containing protein [Mycotypha africana]|uniref:SNF2 family N-terminal domain-containing protein n=1 Tax=Mycotypha africana TaxID=64632 RepID=UPI002301B03D|nr:SNF2 family N-terminal domain-containing protein [Mycotypha africana]KAI8984238.1 SNF2 family N-terminal domain-containing protein [Mycotypha africana]